MSATSTIAHSSTSGFGTNPRVLHQRHQLSVGQGCFHIATVAGGRTTSNGNPADIFRYVVDCGSTKGYRSALMREVSAVRACLGTDVIDVLVVTHMHDDHVVGIPDLLAGPGGPGIDTIMLPFIDEAERLIHFAAVLHRNSVGRKAKFYREFVIDPIAALRPYGPRRIILVQAGPQDPDGGAPGGGGEIPPALIDGLEGDVPYVKGEGWYLGGPCRIERRDTLGDATTGRTDSTGGVLVMDDRNAIVTASFGGEPWLLAPYLDVMVAREKKRFLRGLASELGLRQGELTKLIASPDRRRDLVLNRSDKLRAAYDKLGLNDLNLTSLSVLSTPASDRQSRGQYNVRSFKRLSTRRWLDAIAPLAWMGTGDSDLKNDVRRAGFLRHYQRHLHKIHTLALPHHGSENNFHKNLLEAMTPHLCTVAADRVGKWRHPASSIVQDVASAGVELWSVTSSPLSGFIELFDVRWV